MRKHTQTMIVASGENQENAKSHKQSGGLRYVSVRGLGGLPKVRRTRGAIARKAAQTTEASVP